MDYYPPSTLSPSMLHLSFRLFNQNRVYFSLLLHVCHHPHPSLPPWFNHFIKMWQDAQFMGLLNVWLSPASCYFLTFTGVHSEFFRARRRSRRGGGWGADPEVMYNLCLILKIVL
jgi:hypothetical protein